MSDFIGQSQQRTIGLAQGKPANGFQGALTANTSLRASIDILKENNNRLINALSRLIIIRAQLLGNGPDNADKNPSPIPTSMVMELGMNLGDQTQITNSIFKELELIDVAVGVNPPNQAAPGGYNA